MDILLEGKQLETTSRHCILYTLYCDKVKYCPAMVSFQGKTLIYL